MSIKADISHFFALMKYILDNIDDRQISMMASFGKKISNAALGTPSYDTCERMLHNTGPIDNNTGLGWSARSVSCILVT
jgi:hypothetical protein